MEASATSADGKRDFFISYTGVDEQWAEWIGWELEEAGYTVFLQAWDFDAGAHFVAEMHRATQASSRTIAVLSQAYLRSSYAEAEWQEAWRNDPGGAERRLLVFRIDDCPRPGLLGQLVSVDLFGVHREISRSRLLAAARRGRRKPPLPPNFPLQEPPTEEPPFPGRLVSGTIDEVMEAGGPLTPDNPYAIALGWWYAVLEENYEVLDSVITPESRGRWDLAALKERTKSGGLTTGVMKPRYDVAYVRLPSELGTDDEGPLKVVGGLVPLDARVISLVLRPELGGWKVHGFGFPMDPDDMPRTYGHLG
ncbi:toll/interleukin-1 receptor domain-containing protein [Micromonospora palythoicola]|uniref:toll/interleukin-1 receptor domain-containing protein n=1 Tax=Micromonospora palythoicola TaxID=3120507 RepID=UPI002FCE0052